MEHGIGEAGAAGQVEAAALLDLRGDVDHIAQHREQVLLDAIDHLPVDEGTRRRIGDFQADAPGMAHHAHLEIAVELEQLLGIVAVAAGVEHRQRALAEQRMDAAGIGVEQRVDLRLRQHLQAATRADAGIHQLRQFY
jgi:hypothetical protein